MDQYGILPSGAPPAGQSDAGRSGREPPIAGVAVPTGIPAFRPASPVPLIDPFGRAIRYLRVSVTDRCDLRCTYCMSEAMTFLPKVDLLTLEELDRVCTAFVRQGVRKLRITGGEPLVRRDVLWLFRRLGRHLDAGTLDELTLTTNASRLAEFARPLAACGVRRVNISLDTLDPARFRSITRTGDLARVLAGIDAAAAASLAVKINVVALRGINDHEIPALLHWCGERGFDMTLIEVMPMGEIGESRLEHYLPLSEVHTRLAQRYTLTPLAEQTGGPARYVRVEEVGVRLGLITPLTHTFCDSCNRVRLTCTGRLYLCLGQPDFADLRAVLRTAGDGEALQRLLREAIARKPKDHDFHIDRQEKQARVVSRHMSVTGG